MRGNDMKRSSSGQRRSLFVRIAAVVIALCMIAALALPALASETDDTYKYTVRIFAGKQGKIDGEDVKEYSVTPGQKLNVDWNELKKLIKVTDSRYEATGFRLSGKDNNLYPKTIAEPIVVNSDMDFVVSYALKGSDIQYTIKYLEAGTNKELHKPATITYNGNEGEEFVPTYIYIDGYTPKDPVTTAVKLKSGMTFTCYYTKITGSSTTKTTTKDKTTTTTTKSGTVGSTKKNSSSTTTTRKSTTTTKRTTTTTTKRTTTTTRRVGTASSSTSTVRSSGSTSSYTNPSSYNTTTTTRSYTPNPAGTTASGNPAGTTTGGNTSGSTTTTTRNISGTTASGNTTGTTPGSNTGNRFTANSGNTTNGTNAPGTTPGSTANGTNASGTTPGNTANGTNASGTTPGSTLSGVTNGTNNTPGTSGTAPTGAQGNEAAQTSSTPKELANLNDPNANLKDYSSSGNNTAEVEPTADKSSETTTNSELEGVVRARGMSTPVKVLLGAAIVLLLGGAGWFFFKRFSSEGYTDDDDDTDDQV